MTSEEKSILKILMLEDQEDDADLVKRALRKGGIVFESRRVDDRENFEKALDEFKPDVILSDHSLPQFNSIEALQIKADKAPEIPFILVTGAVSDEFAAQCIKLGADDYILKTNLSRLSASLNNAVEHRTLERMRAEGERILQEQNMQLTKAHKEIDSFVYSVSHNLRSPIASVLGLVNLAKQENNRSVPDTMKYLDLIEKSVKKLDDTIKEILDYSKNERVDLKIEPIDLKTLIDDCLSRLQYIRGYDQITKQINLNEASLFYSDRFRISIMLVNLFSNSIKYCDEHKEHKLLRVKVTVSPEKAIIEVTDNGIGISESRQPLIFNMFYRGTERSDGAGLGLYVVKEVLNKLGGTVAVDSQPDLLTTFTITLPNGKVIDTEG
jgi:signal transduction histidine kinase